MSVLLQRVFLNSAVPHSPPQIDQYQGSEVRGKYKHQGERTLPRSLPKYFMYSILCLLSIMVTLMCLPSSPKFSPLRFLGIHCHIHLIFTQKQRKKECPKMQIWHVTYQKKKLAKGFVLMLRDFQSSQS